MPWTYEQSTGKLRLDGQLDSLGYAGAPPDGKNNPAMQHMPNAGPIPQGWYTIEAPEDTLAHGPYTMRLTPDAANEMFGRGGFLMHGDSFAKPGWASQGCIVMPRLTRERVWTSHDERLHVVA